MTTPMAATPRLPIIIPAMSAPVKARQEHDAAAAAAAARAVIAVVDGVGSKGIVTIVVATAMPPVDVLLAPSFE